MPAPQPKHLTDATHYRALNESTVAEYLAGVDALRNRLGGAPEQWKIREVGDGNLNLVFIVEGAEGSLVVKQALPYVRLVGESWPLPLDRAWFEHEALVEQAKASAPYVPEIYHHDRPMALTAMEYLSPHIILRKGLIRGIRYPHMAEHLGLFLAETLYHTSDLHLPAAEKKRKIALFCANTAMCKITEDLVFTEPYFNAPMNRHTSPQLDAVAEEFQKDAALKAAAQRLKFAFMTRAEALAHGDLHTGSVMVTEEDTRAIDPEFAFYAPIGFDIGMLIANLITACYAQAGHEETPGSRAEYQGWLLAQIPVLWRVFRTRFRDLWLARSAEQPGGDAFAPTLDLWTPEWQRQAAEGFLDNVWEDAVGFCGAEIIRRILGLAHLEEFESIADANTRAACETRALRLAQALLTQPENFRSVEALCERIQSPLPQGED